MLQSQCEPARLPVDLSDPLQKARTRVWAASVRDGGGPGARDARLLCAMLDLMPGTQSATLRDLAKANALALIDRIRESS